jgi:transcriptional regulator with XRE-family HTH domain
MQKRIAAVVGTRIKELREGQGLTQAQLAELARKSVETISNFERGKTAPSLKTLADLAAVLGGDLAHFFGQGQPDVPDAELGNIFRQLSIEDQGLLRDFADLLLKRRLGPRRSATRPKWKR